MTNNIWLNAARKGYNQFGLRGLCTGFIYIS